ncbi:hypothetical protein HOY80DRAFT_1047117 [Tuber brumale]|nr:hypothetical protein HOY80DRAFT_1047117 [Tuber brumale]
MGFRKSCSSVKALLATATVLQQLVEKSLALESENSKLRHHVSVLARRLHKVIAELKAQSKITVAFCPFCGDNHNQVDCELWMERVVEGGKRLEKVEFAGGEDVKPLVLDEEAAVEVEQKIVVRLPVAAAESVAGAVVAQDVAMVEVAGKSKEVAVVAEEAEGGVSSGEEDWTVVKRRVRESGEERRRRRLEKERDAGMRGWGRSDSGYGSPGLSGSQEKMMVAEGVEVVGEGVVPRLLVAVLMGPRLYGGVLLGSEKRRLFKRLKSVPERKRVYRPDLGRRLVVYGGVRDWQRMGRNGYRGMGWYCRNQDGYLI